MSIVEVLCMRALFLRRNKKREARPGGGAAKSVGVGDLFNEALAIREHSSRLA